LTAGLLRRIDVAPCVTVSLAEKESEPERAELYRIGQQGRTNVSDDNGLLERADVADYLAISENHVIRLTKRGELPVVHVGNRHRYRLVDVDAFVERNVHTAGQRA
jgi:excisionase family DNA binding protein